MRVRPPLCMMASNRRCVWCVKFVTASQQGHHTVAAKKREEGSACPCVVGGVKIFEGVYGWDLLWESGNAKFILMM